MTLTEFLLARIDEDEAELGEWVHRDESAGPNGIGWAEVGAISEVLMISHRRARAECEAMRRIVTLAEAAPGGHRALMTETLCLLALPYADHPDYDEAWRP